MKLVGVLCVLVSVAQCQLLAGGWRDVKPTEDDVSVNTISPCCLRNLSSKVLILAKSILFDAPQ